MSDEIYEAIDSDGHIMKFTGEIVAHRSSRLPEKDNWTEFTLYLTDFDTWILQIVGGTKVPGQTNRYSRVVTSEPADFLDKIIGNDVSRLAKGFIRDIIYHLRDCEEVEDTP